MAEALTFHFIPPNGRFYDRVAPNPGVAQNAQALIDKYALRDEETGEVVRTWRPTVEIKDEEGNTIETKVYDQWYTHTNRIIDPYESLEEE